MWLGAAKLWFLVASYATTVALTHLLSATEYGRYSVVSRLIAVPNMVIIYTIMFSVSRPLAAQFERGCPDYEALRARGVRLALVLGGPTALAFFLGAPLFAGLLSKPVLADPIRVVAPISVIYALYAVNLGTLNAVRRFPRQATLDIAMAATKAGLMIVAAAAGLGLAATLGGFTLASLVALALSVVMVRGVRPTPTGAPGRMDSMASLAGLLVVFTALVNLLQSVDMLVLSRFASDAAREDAVGFYASAQQIALVPYSLMNALALLAFPLIASIDQQREPEKVRLYVGQTAKVCIVLLAFMASIASASSQDVQALLFPKAYGAAADELRLLVWGFSGYSFAVTSAWILNSAKRSRSAVLLVALPLLAVVGIELALVPTMFTSGAALAVAIAGALAFVAASVALAKNFSAHVPLATVARVLACIAVVEGIAWIFPATPGGMVGKLVILAKLGVLAVAFVGTALVTRTVTVAELKGLRRAR